MFHRYFRTFEVINRETRISSDGSILDYNLKYLLNHKETEVRPGKYRPSP